MSYKFLQIVLSDLLIQRIALDIARVRRSETEYKTISLFSNNLFSWKFVLHVFLFPKGLAALHANNIVHRDVKPANCLVRSLTPQPNEICCKVSDLGMSRTVFHNLYTRTVDNFRWLAPEMIREVRRPERRKFDDGIMTKLTSILYYLHHLLTKSRMRFDDE